MRIVLSSIFVDDQDKALAFYTTKLGFIKKADVPMGQMRWLTVVSPKAADGPELVLEPDGHPAVKPFKDALVRDGIPLAVVVVAYILVTAIASVVLYHWVEVPGRTTVRRWVGQVTKRGAPLPVRVRGNINEGAVSSAWRSSD